MVEICESSSEQKEIAGEIFDGYVEALKGKETVCVSFEQILMEAGFEGDDKEKANLLREIIKEKLRVDTSKLNKKHLPWCSYVVDGLKGQPSEDGGKANFYRTIDEDIFLKVTDYKNPELGRQYDLVNGVGMLGKFLQEAWVGDFVVPDYEAMLDELE